MVYQHQHEHNDNAQKREDEKKKYRVHWVRSQASIVPPSSGVFNKDRLPDSILE
jgi:hypothetical protein